VSTLILPEIRLRRTAKKARLLPRPSSDSPKKTSGLRSAQPKKKPPMRATISKKVCYWRSSTTKLEPILSETADEHKPRRLFQRSWNAPRQKNPLHIF